MIGSLFGIPVYQSELTLSCKRCGSQVYIASDFKTHFRAICVRCLQMYSTKSKFKDQLLDAFKNGCGCLPGPLITDWYSQRVLIVWMETWVSMQVIEDASFNIGEILQRRHRSEIIYKGLFGHGPHQLPEYAFFPVDPLCKGAL